MTELWQTYGSWVLYGAFFLAFFWLHTRMHMGGGCGSHGSGPDDHADHTHHDDSKPGAGLSEGRVDGRTSTGHKGHRGCC